MEEEMSRSILKLSITSFAALSMMAALMHGGLVQAQSVDDTVVEIQLQQVNINEADAETLAMQLQGVGASRARAIVEYREEHGPFMSVEELTEVNGIGEATLLQNRALIVIE